MNPHERTGQVVSQAHALGFDLCGVAPATKFPELENLSEWLARGYAGEMRYLHNPKRQSPELVLAGARSVIVCAMNYNAPLPYSIEARAMVGVAPGRSPSRQAAAGGINAGTNTVPALQDLAAGEGPRGWISRYAWGDDYHEVLGERLKELVAWMRAEFAEPHEALWYVDTGPIVERVAAKWAGLGWLGKNTCLINEEMGSWLFLCAVVTTLELEPSLEMENGKGKMEKGANELSTAAAPGPSQKLPATSHESPVTSDQSLATHHQPPVTPAPDLCGQCTLCIDACPTNALVEPYVLDARRCISYLTIELRGEIPAEFHQAIGWHIFGCDICQDVCPYNRNAPATDKPEFLPRSIHDKPVASRGRDRMFRPALQMLSALDELGFAAQFEHSPMRRTKHAGLRRNVELALRNCEK